jgi:hypothetical protein
LGRWKREGKTFWGRLALGPISLPALLQAAWQGSFSYAGVDMLQHDIRRKYAGVCWGLRLRSAASISTPIAQRANVDV